MFPCLRDQVLRGLFTQTLDEVEFLPLSGCRLSRQSAHLSARDTKLTAEHTNHTDDGIPFQQGSRRKASIIGAFLSSGNQDALMV